MSPPVQKPKQAPIDPMAEELPPPPPPATEQAAPVSSPEATAEPVPTPVDQDLTILPSTDGVSAAPATESPSTPATPSEFSKKFHLLVSGGYSFGTRYYVDHDAYRNAAPLYTGGHVAVQATYRLYQDGSLELRAGADGSARFLRIPRSPGSVASDAQMYALGGTVEANYSLSPKLGAGLNGTLNGVLLSGDAVDIGAPHTADLGGTQALSVGAAAYLNFKNGVVRAGLGLDWMPLGFALPTGPGSPDFNIAVEPQLKLFVGFDLFQALK